MKGQQRDYLGSSVTFLRVEVDFIKKEEEIETTTKDINWAQALLTKLIVLSKKKALKPL
jgi:ribosomal protein L17